MYYTDQVELGNMIGQDGYGNGNAGAPEFKPKRVVWAHCTKPARAEFYKAAAAGIAITMIIHVKEYEDEPALRHKGRTYNIERAYENRGEWVLNCSDLSVAKGGTYAF